MLAEHTRQRANCPAVFEKRNPSAHCSRKNVFSSCPALHLQLPAQHDTQKTIAGVKCHLKANIRVSSAFTWPTVIGLPQSAADGTPTRTQKCAKLPSGCSGSLYLRAQT
jgi:hypothetical protein